MSDKKLGFPTSASQLHEEFEGVRKMLDGKNVKWGQVTEEADSMVNKVEEGLGKAILAASEKHSLGDEHVALVFMSYHQYWTTLQVLGQLGQELTEVHARLSKVEKAAKELKLAMK